MKAITWDLQAYVPGHSTNVVDILGENYKSDAIIGPNQFVSYCYTMPKLDASVDPALLEFKIAHPYISFAEGQGD